MPFLIPRIFIIQCLIIITLANQDLLSQLNVHDSYDRLATNDGLSSDFVQYSFQDNKGYTWIATSNGLDRFDGKNIKQFRSDPQDSTTLVFNNVLQIAVDQQDRLWIATRGGLCYKNEDDTFVRFNSNPDDKFSLAHDNVTALTEDSKGRIWAGTQNGLCLYDETINGFKVFQYDEEDPNSIGLNSVEAVFEDSKGNIWVSTWDGGLSIIDERDTNSMKFKRLNLGTKNKIGGGCFPKLFEDKVGRIWTFKNDYKLIQVKFPTNKSILDCDEEEIDFIYYDIESESDNFQIHTLDFIENKFLVISSNKGLKTIDAVAFSDSAKIDFKNNYKDFGIDLNFDRSHNFRSDEFGIIWISTSNGLFKLYNYINSSITNKLKAFCLDKDAKLFSLFIEDNNKKWVGTNKGLFVFDKEFETYEKIPLTKDNSFVGEISAILKGDDGVVWVGTYFGRLFSIDKGIIKEYFINSLGDVNNRNIIWDFLFSDNKLWLSTDQGLIVYDPSTNEHQKLFSKDIAGLEGGNTFDIVKDKSENIWVAFMGGGLTRVWFDENGELAFDQKTKGMVSNLILDMDLVEDEIWMATIGGIQGYNIKQDSFYVDDFLKSKTSGAYSSITHDIYNNLWFASSNGLNYFNKEKQQLATFNSFDGIVDQLSLKCSTFDNEGNIYVGGSGGISVFKPLDLISNDTLDKIIFTNLLIDNKSVIKNKKDVFLDKPILTESIEETEAITLTQKHINIRFDFTIPDYLNPYIYEFSYKIENITPNWIDLQNDNTISVTKFDKGDYTLFIKATDSKGNIYKTKELAINVLPYFWQRWWFILGCFIGTLLLLVYIIKRRERNAEAQKIKLESIVQDRTKELEVKNEKLQNSIQSNAQLEQFGHATAHDLKSPLRTISSFSGLLRMTMKDKLSETESGYIDFIENGSKRLMGLVDDLLDYSKINSEKLSLKYIDSEILVKNILNQLKVSIVEKNAVVSIHNNVEEVKCDEIKIGRVIQNLIANAIKFVPKDRQPVIDVYIDELDDNIKFIIKDNGIGISEENQKIVFGVFKRVVYESYYEGTGMGLAMCKKIVEHHGGKIWIESVIDQGSSFIFTIPKEPVILR